MATGTGKSKIFVDACLEALKSNPECRIALIVPTEKLRDENWRLEFLKWATESVYGRIDRYCYASINKIDKTYDLIGADEIHNITEKNSSFFERNAHAHIMGLTATPPEDTIKTELLIKYCPVIYEYTLQEAVADLLVVPFNIEIVEVPLDKTDKYIDVKLKDKHFKTTEAAQYAYLDRLLLQARYTQNKKLEEFRILNRMRFLYNLKSKTTIAKKLIEKCEGKKTLIFCGTIAQAEELCPYRYHSESSNQDYERFINGEIEHLSCVRALNEGMNIPELDAAIIVQSSSKKREIIQRIGRCVRWRENHTAKIYIVNSQGTQDVVWTTKALEGIDKKKINYIHYKNL